MKKKYIFAICQFVIFHAASTRVQEMDHVIEGKKIAITHVINRGSLWMTWCEFNLIVELLPNFSWF